MSGFSAEFDPEAVGSMRSQSREGRKGGESPRLLSFYCVEEGGTCSGLFGPGGRAGRADELSSGGGKRSTVETEAPASGESRRQQRLPRPTATAPAADSTLYPWGTYSGGISSSLDLGYSYLNST
jgi:hypothetical protein